MKNIFSMLLLMAAISLGFNANAQTTPDALKTTEIKVKGINCGNDSPTIKKKLLNQEGIDDVSYSSFDGGPVTFKISYHSSVTSEDKIVGMIEGTPGCDDPSAFPYKSKVLHAKKGKNK